MDFIDIKHKYNKAYSKWYNFTQTDLCEKVLQSRNHVYYSGLLYSFFDENGIYISIEFYMGRFTPVTFGYDIMYHIVDGCEVKTRKESEEHAFTKAFEILESKLK